MFYFRRSIMVAVVLLAVTFTAAQEPVRGQSSAFATTAGFGAAFAHAQTIGPVAFTQTGSIGNGTASAIAIVPHVGIHIPTYKTHYPVHPPRHDPHKPTYHDPHMPTHNPHKPVYSGGGFASSHVSTAGNASAFAGAISSPFGTNAYVNAVSFPHGFATGGAVAR
ncbi:MAG: hypothetical protein AAF787_17275 [Chloroflexota bacterium]